jgi:hypothetical protein
MKKMVEIKFGKGNKGLGGGREEERRKLKEKKNNSGRVGREITRA